MVAFELRSDRMMTFEPSGDGDAHPAAHVLDGVTQGRPAPGGVEEPVDGEGAEARVSRRAR